MLEVASSRIKTIKAFLELHIEQGPILEEKNIPIGIVEAIVGLTQLEVTIQGQAGHAGTTPMERRSDALVTAAEIIAAFPQLALEEGNGTVITTGQLHVSIKVTAYIYWFIFVCLYD